MLIRAEQMTVFELTAEENFRRRLAAHLLESYSTAIIKLPETEAAVNDLPAEKLHSLVAISVERARHHGLTFESSISAFSALMFEVSPNFDSHRLSQVMLSDENIEPDARLNELLEVLTEKNWESIRQDYDVNEWQPEAGEKPEEVEPSGKVKADGSAETAIHVEKPVRTKDSIAIDDINFDETTRNDEGAGKPAQSAAADEDFDLLATVPNFVVPKE